MSEHELRELAARIQALEFVVEGLLTDWVRNRLDAGEPADAASAHWNGVRRSHEPTMPHDVLRAVEHLWRRVIAGLTN